MKSADVIVDAQSVKNTDTAEQKGYDAGKKVSGIKDILPSFTVMPKRWVVERSFAWLEKCRRLWKNCERKLNTSVQFVTLAFLALLIQRS